MWDKDSCSAHFMRTVVLKEIVLRELNKLLAAVKENEDKFVQVTMRTNRRSRNRQLLNVQTILIQLSRSQVLNSAAWTLRIDIEGKIWYDYKKDYGGTTDAYTF